MLCVSFMLFMQKGKPATDGYFDHSRAMDIFSNKPLYFRKSPEKEEVFDEFGLRFEKTLKFVVYDNNTININTII